MPSDEAARRIAAVMQIMAWLAARLRYDKTKGWGKSDSMRGIPDATK
jgi:hypothetical protein